SSARCSILSMISLEMRRSLSFSAGLGRTRPSTISLLSKREFCQVFVDGASGGQGALFETEFFHREASQVQSGLGVDPGQKLPAGSSIGPAHPPYCHMGGKAPLLRGKSQ